MAGGGRPHIDGLPSLVDLAIAEVRLYMYRVPEHLAAGLNLASNNLTSKNASCHRQRSRHPWINLEHRLWEMLPEQIWTDDPEQATFFVVPHAYLGHKCSGNEKAAKAYVRDGLVPFLRYLYYVEPYYNRTRGRDHVLTWIFENGPLCDCTFRGSIVHDPLAFGVLMSMIKVGYWAHENTDMFGWRRGVDIAMPQFGAVGPAPSPPPPWDQIVAKPKYSFGFAGSFWGDKVGCPAFDKHAAPGTLAAGHACSCSPGVRVWLQKYLGGSCNTTELTTTRCDQRLGGQMGTFWYALCPAGWACWSSRLYHAIDRLVVPVIMANGAEQPFEAIFDWASFAVRLNTLRLLNGNTSQLDWLHHSARTADRHCSTCQTCHSCAKQQVVKQMRTLGQVRPWFLYNSSTPYSALGLFVLELHCRQYYRTHGAGDGVCQRVSYSPDVIVHGRRRPRGAPTPRQQQDA